MKTTTKILLTSALTLGVMKGCFIHRYQSEIKDIGSGATRKVLTYMDNKVEEVKEWANPIYSNEVVTTNLVDKIQGNYMSDKLQNVESIDTITNRQLNNNGLVSSNDLERQLNDKNITERKYDDVNQKKELYQK
jgi:hypothetical protein